MQRIDPGFAQAFGRHAQSYRELGRAKFSSWLYGVTLRLLLDSVAAGLAEQPDFALRFLRRFPQPRRNAIGARGSLLGGLRQHGRRGSGATRSELVLRSYVTHPIRIINARYAGWPPAKGTGKDGFNGKQMKQVAPTDHPGLAAVGCQPGGSGPPGRSP